MVTLENDFLKVSIRSQGAELTSVYSKKDGVEYLWQANPDVWPWHAPNLFPVIGACVNNSIHVDGNSYPIARHGFTRESVFKRIESTRLHAKFSLISSEETFKSYPYKFEFQILYDLFDNKLRVSYKVINLDKGTIYFSVGAHPAFNVPFSAGESYEDYYLEFERPESLETHLLTDSLFNGQTEPVQLDGNNLQLTAGLFDKDALVLKNLLSRKVTLKSKNHDKSICVSFPHFNYLGLWAKPGADFVCIEPWLGCADTNGLVTDIKDKEAIQHAHHGHVFETEFCIQVNA